VHLGPQLCSISELRTAWIAAEALGFDWVSVWDHFIPSPWPDHGASFEAVACQTALAMDTSRVRVGSLVYCTAFRHPAVLAKAAVTIDHLSGGRMELGLGAGWLRDEFDMVGIPFESPGVRLRRLEETVRVIRALWSGERCDIAGEFYTLTGATSLPTPVQGAPRIWIGASQPRALQLAGRAGDGWNVAYQAAADFERKRDVVLSAAADPATFQTSVEVAFVPCTAGDEQAALRRAFGDVAPFLESGALTGEVASMVEAIETYRRAGADLLVLAMRPPFDLDALAALAEALRLD